MYTYDQSGQLKIALLQFRLVGPGPGFVALLHRRAGGHALEAQRRRAEVEEVANLVVMSPLR